MFTAALLLASCCGQPAQDRLLGPGGKALKNIEVAVQTETPEAFPGMTVRTVTFTNAGPEPVLVSAMETSRIRFESKKVWALEPMTYEDRRDWVQPVEPGYHQDNFLGMTASDYGGGTPLVSLWNAERNVTVGLVEPCLRIVSIPVTRKWNTTLTCVRKEYDEPVELQPGESLTSYANFIIEGKGDFFGPVREFSEYMQAVNGIQAPVSPDEAYDAVWCAWGYERQFTVDEVIGTLPKVVELGFKWVDVDDGFQICEGDWASSRLSKSGTTSGIFASSLAMKRSCPLRRNLSIFLIAFSEYSALPSFGWIAQRRLTLSSARAGKCFLNQASSFSSSSKKEMASKTFCSLNAMSPKALCILCRVEQVATVSSEW